MKKHHFYEPKIGHGLAHDPLNSIIAPRPIGWVSSLSAAGFRNLAPYSFFQLFNYVPPIIGFSSIGWKDSVANIAETGEFVWNLASRSLAEAMNASSASVARDVDEFTLAGLEATPSALVKPPRVAASPAAFECKLIEIHQLKRADGEKLESWLVLGEVVGVHLASDTIIDGTYQTTAAQPVLRGGGWGDYFEVTEAAKFRMKRPE
ncbi:MAG: flavin reductase family protein [Sphingomonas sp.]|uniref:flavin reductase family protein n=1 Tax=Sphingomonas sp. TaxID=28214 RepID=UPI0025F8477F|nr:flavin reductase family protein [Sphingomonas sp.]MBX9883259.1 flavin reductase family protein [Sphingomonas sp.]